MNIPRVPLAITPTPIEFLPRLSAKLNRKIYIKRDDCTGLGGGGNKARKLEYLFADAKAKGADTVITVGGLQSNHARQTAAAAAQLGFGCELVLKDVAGSPNGEDYYRNGNVLLDQLFGANVHKLNVEQNAGAVIVELTEQIKSQGKVPYFIDLGGSNVIGNLGYIHCAEEIKAQSDELGVNFDAIVHATGSSGTQAGLLTGLAIEQMEIDVHGICVLNNAAKQHKLVSRMCADTLNYLEQGTLVDDIQVICHDDYLGPGYGIATEQTIAALRLCAQLEGILLDPVYTAKAMAGLIDLCQSDKFAEDDNILFIHTGGSVGLFAYGEVLT